MYYKKNLQTYSPKTYTYNLSDFSRGINTEIDENLLQMNYAKTAYNVKLDDKSLRSGYGIAELEVPHGVFEDETIIYQLPADTKPLGLWCFKIADDKARVQDILLLYCDDKQLYYTFLCGPINTFMKSDITLEAKPTILTYVYNGLETAVICSPLDSMYFWNGTATPVSSDKAIHLSSMCSHYERLFASSSDKKNEIRFSQDFDISNWEETSQAGGFIQLVDERGYINKVISFNDYVYIIREYGISRLSAYGDQSEFSITHLNLSSNKIYANTAVLCGDRIILLTSNGLHYCTGGSLYKYDFDINRLINKEMMQYACACYFNNKYYLATRIDFDDDKKIGCELEEGYRNNVLVEFDLETQKINLIRGIDVCNMCVLYHDKVSKIAFLFNGQNSNKIGQLSEDGNLFGDKLTKLWQSPLSDLGTPKTKVVKSVTLQTQNKLTVLIRSENESQTLTILPSNKTQTILCNVVGTKISVEFSSNEMLHISNPTIQIEVLD